MRPPRAPHDVEWLDDADGNEVCIEVPRDADPAAVEHLITRLEGEGN